MFDAELPRRLTSRSSGRITAAVILLEDFPQLILNTAVYLGTMGTAAADPVAIFALVMSILSLIANCGLLYLAYLGGSVFEIFDDECRDECTRCQNDSE